MRTYIKYSYLRMIAAVLCLFVVSCTATDVTYVSRSSLLMDPLYIINESDMKKPTQYGAFKLQGKDDSENQGMLFVVQKKKSVYQTEIMFKATEDKKYYFSVGVDYKNQTPAVGFRVEF
jgi:hypothetical protein